MFADRKTENRWTRRKTLSGLAALGVVSATPARPSAGSLDDTVAEKARKLANGRDIRMRILLPQGSGGNVKPVIEAFEAKTGLKIVPEESQVDDINTELTLHALSQSNKYDLALPATFGVPDLVSAGAIRDVDDFAAQHEPPQFRQSGLYRIGDSFDDRVFGFQADGDAYLMFYNRSFLENPEEHARYEDQHGIPLERPSTWTELDRQMAFFNRPDDGQWGGLLFRSRGYLAWEWWVRFHAKGYWPFSPDMEPQILSDPGIEALEDLIAATQSQCPEVHSLGLFENWERYSKGDIYCNIGWGGSQKYLNSPRSAMRDRMEYGPMPGGIVEDALLETPYFNWGWSYVVPTNSRYPEIAYLFALFASTPAMSTLSVRQKDGFFDPHRPEHYKDEGIRQTYSPAFLKVHRASLEGAIPDLYLQGQTEYFRALNDGLHRALVGTVSPKTALERIVTRWQLTTNSFGRGAQIRRWQRLKEKYPAKARLILRNLS